MTEQFPSNQSDELVRLLRQRYDDEGDTISRKAADEIERLRAEVERLHADNAELWGTLAELRIRYHAAGRRPEECYEMSLIDATLHGIVRGVADVAEDRS